MCFSGVPTTWRAQHEQSRRCKNFLSANTWYYRRTIAAKAQKKMHSTSGEVSLSVADEYCVVLFLFFKKNEPAKRQHKNSFTSAVSIACVHLISRYVNSWVLE